MYLISCVCLYQVVEDALDDEEVCFYMKEKTNTDDCLCKKYGNVKNISFLIMNTQMSVI